MNISSLRLPIPCCRDTRPHVGNPTLEKRSKTHSRKHAEGLVVSVPISEKVSPGPVREGTKLSAKVASRGVERQRFESPSKKGEVGRPSRVASSGGGVRTSDGCAAETLSRSVDCLKRGGASRSIETGEGGKKLLCPQAKHENWNQTAVTELDSQSLNLRAPLPSKPADRNKEGAAELSTQPAAVEIAAQLEPHQWRERFNNSDSEVGKPPRKRNRVCTKRTAIEYTDSESEAPPTRRDPPTRATLKREDSPLKHTTDPRPSEPVIRGDLETVSGRVAKERVGVAKQRPKVRARKRQVPVEESTDEEGLPPPKPVKPVKRPRKQAKSSAIDCSNRKEPAASPGQQRPLPLATAEAIKRPKKRVRKQAAPERRQAMGEPKRPRGRPRKKGVGSQQLPRGSKSESQSQQQAEGGTGVGLL